MLPIALSNQTHPGMSGMWPKHTVSSVRGQDLLEGVWVSRQSYPGSVLCPSIYTGAATFHPFQEKAVLPISGDVAEPRGRRWSWPAALTWQGKLQTGSWCVA